MKISILTACFNKAKYIMPCINSILDQSYPNWELIVVDDCSTDNSWEILKKIKDNRITILRNEKRVFCSSSYARALDCATGDVVGIVDGDDMLTKKAAEMIIKRYQRHPEIDHIYTQFHWCDKHLKKCRTGLSALPKTGKSLADMVLAGRHCYSHWRTFRRKLAAKGTLFPKGLEVSVDKNLGFTLEEFGRGAFLPKKLYFYRYYHGNMSLVKPEQQKETTLALARAHRRKRKELNIRVFPIIEIK